MSKNPAAVVPVTTRIIPTQSKGTQTEPEKKKATRGIHVQTEQVLKVVNPEVTQLPKKHKPIIRKMPANKYESAVPQEHTQEEETHESVAATNKEEKVYHTEIKVGEVDDDRNGYITPQKTPDQADVKENIEDNKENEEQNKKQNQMDKGSNEKPKQMDEGEGNVEQDQAKDTEDPANADTPEMCEKTFVVETMHGNGPGVFLEESDLLQPIPEDRGDVLPSMSDGSNPEPKDDDDNPPSGGDEAVQAPETVEGEPVGVSNDPVNP